jgi:DNA-binding transcriptional regulator YiaG
MGIASVLADAYLASAELSSGLVDSALANFNAMETPSKKIIVTDGATKLGALVEELKLTQTAAAAALGATSAAMTDWLSGRRRPDPVMRRRIHRWSAGRVPPESWETPDERGSVDAVVPVSPAA